MATHISRGCPISFLPKKKNEQDGTVRWLDHSLQFNFPIHPRTIKHIEGFETQTKIKTYHRHPLTREKEFNKVRIGSVPDHRSSTIMQKTVPIGRPHKRIMNNRNRHQTGRHGLEDDANDIRGILHHLGPIVDRGWYINVAQRQVDPNSDPGLSCDVERDKVTDPVLVDNGVGPYGPIWLQWCPDVQASTIHGYRH